MTIACGDEGKDPGDMNEIECDGESKVTVIEPCPEREEEQNQPRRVDVPLWGDA